jgi:mitochondrial fission protein ELM1
MSEGRADSARSAPLHGFTWGVTEGAAGMVSQVKGLAQAVGLPFEVHAQPLREPWRSMWPGIVPAARFIFRNPGLFNSPPPSLLITCGKQAVMTALYLKKKLGPRIYTVHIQDPKISSRYFDLLITPEHDGVKGDNVIATHGALHHVTPEVLHQAAEGGPRGGLENLGRPFVAVLIGGPTKNYPFSEGDLSRLEEKLERAAKDHSVGLAILPSRRTPDEVVARLQRRFGEQHFVWKKGTENPYLNALALATHVIVTCDSVSMITEATATGRPVYVDYSAERSPSKRLKRFYESFERAGAIRSFSGQLSSWSYSVRNDTAAVARIIRERMESSPCPS